MRILLLTQFFQPEPMFKGLPLAQALRERGHQVSVLTGFPNYPGGRLYPGYECQNFRREIMDGIVVDRVPLFPSHDRSGVRRALNYLSFGTTASVRVSTAIEKPDVVWVYNLVTLAPTWNLLRTLHGCRVVLDVQDLWPDSIFGSGMLLPSPRVRKIIHAYCAWAYSNADAVVAQSPGHREWLHSIGVEHERVRVIYNWTEETAGNPTAAERRAAREKAKMDGRFTVLFAGTMGTAQALDCVVEAAKLIAKARPEVQFVFVGGGVDVERLKSLATSAINIRFLPRCSTIEAAALALESEALLVHLKDTPYLRITIPSKVQAYLRVGRPIIIGVRGDAADLVMGAGAGIRFEPENAASLVAAVERLVCSDARERKEMGLAGRRFYEAHLAMDRAVASLESLFFEITSGRCRLSSSVQEL